MISAKFVNYRQNPGFIVVLCIFTLLFSSFVFYMINERSRNDSHSLIHSVENTKQIMNEGVYSILKLNPNDTFNKKKLQVFISELQICKDSNTVLIDKLHKSTLQHDRKLDAVLNHLDTLQKKFENIIREVIKSVQSNKSISHSLQDNSITFHDDYIKSMNKITLQLNDYYEKNINSQKFFLLVITFLSVGLSLTIVFYTIHSFKNKRNSLISKLQLYKYENQLLQYSSIVTATIQKDGKFIWVSSSCKNIFGYKAEEIIGRQISEFLDKESYQSIAEYLISPVLNSGHIFRALFFRTTDSYIWVEIFVKPILSTSEEFVCEIKNITDKKNLEESLIESQTKYQAVFDNMFDGFAYYKVLLNENDQTEDYVLLEVNDAFERLTGLSRKNVIGKKLTEIFPGIKESRYNWIGKYDKVALQGEIVNFEHYASNIERWYNISSYSPIKGYFVTLFEDITQRKKDEKAIKHYISELQSSKDKIERNVNELAQLNNKLSESEKVLKELNSNKDKFFSIIAHDLRTPFNSLIGLSDLLTNQVDSLSIDEIKEFSSNIHSSSVKLFSLLENLLKWAGLQSGRIAKRPIFFDMDLLIHSVAELYRNNLADKEINLVLNLISHTKVFADKEMIETVLRNLFSNAIKFTHKSGKITIEMNNKPSFTEISVSDSGIGIDQNIIDKLFKISEHITSPGTQNEKGTGLGLILCKDFVEKNGGFIKVYSEPGKGSKFVFTIPRS